MIELCTIIRSAGLAPCALVSAKFRKHGSHTQANKQDRVSARALGISNACPSPSRARARTPDMRRAPRGGGGAKGLDSCSSAEFHVASTGAHQVRRCESIGQWRAAQRRRRRARASGCAAATSLRIVKRLPLYPRRLQRPPLRSSSWGCRHATTSSIQPILFTNPKPDAPPAPGPATPTPGSPAIRSPLKHPTPPTRPPPSMQAVAPTIASRPWPIAQ